jgi:hypothetical protein
MFEPGKYDKEASAVLEQTSAEAIILVVVKGNRGNGLSVQCYDPLVIATLPSRLRLIAASIEANGEHLRDAMTALDSTPHELATVAQRQRPQT